MTHQDEYEMLIEYSEMTAFNFKSKEFQEVRKDVMKCKNFISYFVWNIKHFANKFATA